MIFGESAAHVSLLLLSDEELFAPLLGKLVPALLFGTTTAGTDLEVDAFPKSFILLVFTTLVFLTLAGSFPVLGKVILGFGTSSFLIPRASLVALELVGLISADPSPLVELSAGEGLLFLAGTRRLLRPCGNRLEVRGAGLFAVRCTVFVVSGPVSAVRGPVSAVPLGPAGRMGRSSNMSGYEGALRVGVHPA